MTSRSVCTVMEAKGRTPGDMHGETLHAGTGSACVPEKDSEGPGHEEGLTVPDVVPKGLPLLSLPLYSECILC